MHSARVDDMTTVQKLLAAAKLPLDGPFVAGPDFRCGRPLRRYTRAG